MLRWIPVVAVLLATPGAAAPLTSRDESLINTFQTMCNLERPNFARIDARAAAMRMTLQGSESRPLANDTVMRRKTWLGNLTTGPFGILLEELSGPQGVSTGCAVFGTIADPDAFRGEIVREMHLSPPSEPRIENGSRSFGWDNISGRGTILIVRDLTPSGKPGIMVKLLSMQRNP